MRTVVMMLSIALAAATAGCDGDDQPTDAGTDGGDADAPDCEHEDDCDDGIECTASYCQGGRCRYTTEDALCDDGHQCNGAETCDPIRGCVAGEPLLCDDNIECTDDACDTDLDRCVSTPNNDNCADGYVCDRAQEGCIPG
jgi:hypothetical protein